jgi:glycosyltransferase involved in cell wall biosynthesis
MALGLPVVTDRVIGDVARIIEESGAGVLVDGFDPEAYAEALDRVRQLRPDKHRWRSSFDRWFSLPEGVRRYASIYEQLAG